MPVGQLPDPIAFSPVVITPREIYDAVIRVSAQVASIQQEMVQHTDEHRKRDEDFHSFREDHEKRLRSLERSRWPLPSIAVLVSVGSLIAMIVLAKV